MPTPQWPNWTDIRTAGVVDPIQAGGGFVGQQCADGLHDCDGPVRFAGGGGDVAVAQEQPDGHAGTDADVGFHLFGPAAEGGRGVAVGADNGPVGLIEPGALFEHGPLDLNLAALADLIHRAADVIVGKGGLAVVAFHLRGAEGFHDQSQVQRVNPRAENPGESHLVARGGMEPARRLAEAAEEIAAQEADRAGHPQQGAEFRLELFAGKGAGKGQDGPVDLMGDIVVHNHAAPGVGRPFRDVRLRFGDDGKGRAGQVRVGGEGQKDLAVGKSDVGDDDQIHARRSQLVRHRQRLVRAEDALGDDGLRINLPGLEQTFIIGADRLLGLVLGSRIEHFDGIEDQPDLRSRPPLQWSQFCHISKFSLITRHIGHAAPS